MTRFPFYILFLAGIAAGSAAASWSRHYSLRTGEAPAAKLLPVPEAGASSPEEAGAIGSAPIDQRAPRCRQEAIQALELRARIRALEVAHAGGLAQPKRTADPRCTPVPWPAELPEKYREDALRAALGARLRGQEFELDCSEFPCLAVVAHPSEQDDPLSALKEGAYGDAKVLEHNFATNGSSYSFSAPVPPSAMTEDLWLRVHERVEAHTREIVRAEREQAVPEPTTAAPAPLKLVFPLPGSP